MKFPEHCIYMEARLPSTVHKWLKQELELLGIDSLIYTRYIISLLLHQDVEDLDWYEHDEVFYRKSKVDKWRKKGKKQDLKGSISEEEAKKTAVIDCLSAVSEEKTGIKDLVEELCTKLKEEETDLCPNQSTPTTSESSEDSGTENQNPVERYYAAFPSLTSQEPVPNTNQSPSVNLWKKNPLTKAKSLPSTNTPGSDCGNQEDAEVRKINVSCKIAVPKNRKPKKNSSRSNNRSSQEKRKSAQKPAPPKPSHVRRKSLQDGQPISMQSWPPGFAKTDPYVLQNIDMYGNKLVLRSDIKQPQDEICTQVEQILKGYLLPAPDKAYKELQDVDNTYLEQRERVKKAVVKEVAQDLKNESTNEKTAQKQPECGDDCTDEQLLMRRSIEESVSPELREQEIWYTQPINVIFQDEEEEAQDSKLRLYKRNSLSSSSPGITSGGSDVQNPDCFLSSDSSPVCIQRDGRSTDDSDFILQDSDLIPAWLTEELLADLDGDSGYMRDEEFSFKASSPNPTAGECGLDVFRNLELVLDNSDNLADSLQSNRSGSNTPTCNMTTVSLVDIGYLSNLGQDYPDNYLYDNFTATSAPRRYSFSSWQSCVLLENPISPDLYQQPESLFGENQWWQPLDIGGYFMAQLWDVNMQKRTKISSWETNTSVQENQIWWSENMLIFHDTVSDHQRECVERSPFECRNTLIPQISIDVCDYSQSEYDDVSDDLTDEDGTNVIFPPQFDRSLSLGDMYGWVNRSHRYDETQLSKSFDLVPSKHSAFYDVPRKLVHVHSEPNLVQFRQDFLDENHCQAASPQEHLFFSPKTHFRPITPAYAPELTSTSSSKAQYVLNDLFGGLPTTKTPYQRFHVNEGESEEESFVPKFKLKNFSKSIQTGEGFDTAGSSDNEEDAVESEMRDTPETLTLGMIEDVMGEKDEDFDPLGPISEDFDTANTDSAYETDYGVSSNECGQDNHPEGCRKRCQHEHFKQEKVFTCESNRQAEMGNVIDYDIQSFQATYPHTQDWPDLSQSLHCPQDSGQFWNTDWHSHSYHGYPVSNTWSVDDFLAGGETEANEEERNSDDKVIGNSSSHNLDPWLPDQYAGSYIEHCLTSGQWVEDIGGNVFLDENYDVIYPVTWSSFDKDDVYDDASQDFTDKPLQAKADAAIVDHMFNIDLSPSGSAIQDVDRQKGDGSSSSYQRLKVFSSKFFGTDDNVAEVTVGESCIDDNVGEGKGYVKIGNSDTGSEKSDSGIQLETEMIKVNNSNQDMDFMITGEGNDDSVIQFIDKSVNIGDKKQSAGDIHRVKLVYKDNFEDSSRWDKCKIEMLKGSVFMALPDDVRLSTDLEKEWLDSNMKNSCEGLVPSSFQRKPCSFFLEGNCRRTDCKFAHDIANITCRFWEEGGCFKGPLCPFLHGYPSIPSSNDKSSRLFELQNEEFPELSSSVGRIMENQINIMEKSWKYGILLKKNSGHPKKEKMSASTVNKDCNKDRMIRPPSKLTAGTSVKREKHRKQNRRHSNKENRVEICIIDKCSNSI